MRIFPFPSRIRLRGFVLESKMWMNGSRRKVAEVAGILKGADIDYKDQGISRWRLGSISSTVPLM